MRAIQIGYAVRNPRRMLKCAMRVLLICLFLRTLAAAQGGRGAANAPPAASTAAVAAPSRAAFIRENYSKFEYRVPMRDGAARTP